MTYQPGDSSKEKHLEANSSEVPQKSLACQIYLAIEIFL